MDSSPASLLVTHIVNALHQHRQDHTHPFPFHTVSEILPRETIAALRALPCKPLPLEGTRAAHNATRQYFTGAFQAQHPVAAEIAAAFQNSAVVKALEDTAHTSLKGTHVLVEICADEGTSALVPHRDIGVKKFTALFYLSDDPALAHAGTDLYTPKAECAEHIAAAAAQTGEAPREMFLEQSTRPAYGQGLGYYFVPSDKSWHGFDQRPLGGLRQTLMVNFIGPAANGESYRNTHNLAFPENPV